MNDIGILIKKINNRLEAGRNRDLKDLKLTGAQLDILLFLSHQSQSEKTIVQKDIGEFLAIKHTSTIDILKKLEEKQLIYRETNQDNARCRNVYLTEKGKQLTASLSTKKDKIEAILLEGFSETEHQQLWQQLMKIYNNIENI